jgi:thiamine-monophosphate kinase
MSFSESDFLQGLFPLLKSSENLLLPPGDDCAVIKVGNRQLALSVDQVIEGRHYLPSSGPFAAGRKLMARNLSDLAAVGAEPQYALSSSASGPDKNQSWLQEFHKGILSEAEKFGVLLIGGDLAATASDTVNSLTIIGEVKGSAATRSGASDGCLVYVTGEFGRSFQTEHHLNFSPRVKEGIWLADRCQAMIDITDGLLIDCLRVSSSSNCGVLMNPEDVPARENASLKERLTDGEDYELLFAIKPEDEKNLLDDWPFVVKLSKIGAFSADIQAGTAMESNGRDLSGLYGNGYDHFNEDC